MLDKYLNQLVKRYSKFDGAHDEEHALMVMKNSVYIANRLMKEENENLNINMVKNSLKENKENFCQKQ